MFMFFLKKMDIMKKLFSVLAGFVFITVLFLNLKMNTESKNVADIQLENLEALACYTLYVEGGPLAPGMCCEPWYYFCYYDEWSGINFDGWPVY